MDTIVDQGEQIVGQGYAAHAHASLGNPLARDARDPLALLGVRHAEVRRQVESLDEVLDPVSDRDHAQPGGHRGDDVVIQQRQSTAAVQAILLAELRQIEHAMQRAADGQYGTCEDCGGGIAARRLEVVPAATRCISCQGLLEEVASRSAH